MTKMTQLNVESVFNLLKNNIQIVITVIVVAVLSSYMGMWSQKSEIDEWIDKYELYRDNSQQLARENRILQNRVTNLTSFVEEINDSIVKLNRNLDVKLSELSDLRSDLDSIRISIAPGDLEVTPPAVQAYVAVLENTVRTQETVIDEMTARDRLRVAQIDTLLLTNGLLVSQLDSINTFLDNIPETPNNPDKILGIIPKPTRTQSFIAGVGLTLLVVFGVN